jgi:ABC-type dipeptide/oligopeptide/nickel transport system permease subunit
MLTHVPPDVVPTIIVAAVALSLAVFGFDMLGDALRGLLDPRLEGG